MRLRFKAVTFFIIVLGLICYSQLFYGHGVVNSIFLFGEKVYITSGRYFGVSFLKADFKENCGIQSGKIPNVTIRDTQFYTHTIYLPLILTDNACENFKFNGFDNKWEDPTPGNARDVLVYQTDDEEFLYIADGKRGLRIYNNQNPSSPQLHTILNVPDARKLLNIGNTIYVAAGKDGVIAVDISNPKMPKIRYSYPMDGFVSDIDKYIRSETITTKIYLPSDVAKLNIPNTTTSIITTTFILAAAESNGLVLIDIDDPILPYDYPKLEIPDIARCVTSDFSSYALIGGEKGVYVVDLFRFPDLEIIGFYKTFEKVEDIITDQKFAYLVLGDDGLLILDLTKKTNIKEVGHLDTPGWANSIQLKNNFAIIGDGDAGIRVLNIYDPNEPEEVGSFELSSGESRGDRLLREITSFSNIAPLKNSIRHIGIDLILFPIFLLSTLVFLTNFILPVQGTAFNFSYIYWPEYVPAEGNTFIVGLFRLVYFFVAIVKSIWKSIWDHFLILVAIIRFWFGLPGANFFIINGRIWSKNDQFYPLHTGVNVLNRKSAAVFQKRGGKLSTRRAGVSFFGRAEFLSGTADLEKRTLLLGPLPDEDPFAFRLERETLRGYKDRYQRYQDTVSKTLDGREVGLTIRMEVAIADEDQNPSDTGIINAIVDQYKPTGFHQSKKVPAPNKFEYLRVETSKLWRDYLGRFEYDELFSPCKNDRRMTTLQWITASIGDHLMQPQDEKIDGTGNTRVRLFSVEFDGRKFSQFIDGGNVPEVLSQQFADHEHVLSSQARLNKESESSWMITDGNKNYLILFQNQMLKVALMETSLQFAIHHLYGLKILDVAIEAVHIREI